MCTNWKEFLEKIADDHDLYEEKRETFRVMFADKGKIKSMTELSVALNLGKSAVKKRMGKVYDKFPTICPSVNGKRSRGQASALQVWLNQQYSAQSKPKSVEAASSSAIASLPSCSSSFQTIIDDKTKDFVGREYVFDAIANFLTNQPNGYFIIEGDPGMGKSAILAEYVRRTGCLAHFNMQQNGENRADQFLKSVCTQLIERYQLPNILPLNSDVTGDGEFLRQLLEEAAKKTNREKVVIAIDALDEVDSSSSDANILYLPRYLSEGVYFVMTRRRGVENLFFAEVPQELLNLMDYPDQSREDVRAYIEKRVNGSELLRQKITERGETDNDFIDKITEKSENNFMYLVYVLQDIENGLYQDLSLEMFPKGLQKYYEFHWQDMGMTTKPLPVIKINIVYHLAESHQPISRQLLSEYVGEPPLTVQEVLDDWEQFLHKPILEREKCYSVYHSSFRDFLHRQDIVQAAGVSLQAIKKQKSDNLWKAMFGNE